jgi:hypothetical protein
MRTVGPKLKRTEMPKLPDSGSYLCASLPWSWQAHLRNAEHMGKSYCGLEWPGLFWSSHSRDSWHPCTKFQVAEHTSILNLFSINGSVKSQRTFTVERTSSMTRHRTPVTFILHILLFIHRLTSEDLLISWTRLRR